MPIAVQVYIVATLLVSGVVLASFFPTVANADSEELVIALAAGLSIVIASTHVIPVSHRIAVTATVSISFGAILLLGDALATWTTAVGVVLGSGYLSLYQKRWPWYTGAFNSGAYTLTTAATAAIYRTVAGNFDALLLSTHNIIALLVAGITYLVVNTGLVAIVIVLRWNRDPWHTWISGLKETAAEYLTLILLAILMAVAYNYRPWALLLIVLPIIIVYHSLKTSQELRVQTIEAVQALADVIDSRDPYTAKHSHRVAEYAQGLARELSLPAEEIEIILLSAQVHDLGKIGIRDDLLYKPGKFTAEERSMFQQHVRIGAEILERFPRYKEGRDIILHHHEHYDGKGYLEGLRGDEIPIGARILAVADAYDAMTTDRPYRPALTHAEAVDELKRCSGSQFDPVVVGAFLKYRDRVERRTTERAPASAVRVTDQ